MLEVQECVVTMQPANEPPHLFANARQRRRGHLMVLR
jgi:hypothetical protein